MGQPSEALLGSLSSLRLHLRKLPTTRGGVPWVSANYCIRESSEGLGCPPLLLPAGGVGTQTWDPTSGEAKGILVYNHRFVPFSQNGASWGLS